MRIFHYSPVPNRSAAPNSSASRKNSKNPIIVPPWIVVPVGKCQVYRYEFPKPYTVYILESEWELFYYKVQTNTIMKRIIYNTAKLTLCFNQVRVSSEID